MFHIPWCPYPTIHHEHTQANSRNLPTHTSNPEKLTKKACRVRGGSNLEKSNCFCTCGSCLVGFWWQRFFFKDTSVFRTHKPTTFINPAVPTKGKNSWNIESPKTTRNGMYRIEHFTPDFHFCSFLVPDVLKGGLPIFTK